MKRLIALAIVALVVILDRVGFVFVRMQLTRAKYAWLLLVILLTVSISTVSAHAKLVKADPAPNAVLAQAPSRVQLWFDEPIEIGFSEVQVLDANQKRVDTGTLQLAPGDPYSVIAPLHPGGDGIYKVLWKVLSAADGHITRGVFAYSVGDTAGLPGVPVETTSFAASELTPLSALTRWLHLLSLLALVGGFVFRAFLLERSLDAIEVRKPVRAAARQRWLQLTLFAFVLFFVASIGEWLLQAGLVSDALSFGAIGNVLLNTRFGALWLMRTGLMAACALVIGLTARGVRIPQASLILILVGSVALMTRSLLGHAAVSGNLSPPVFADWLHLLGVSIWVGGLFYLAFVMPFVWRTLEAGVRGKWIAWLVPQFSLAAIGATTTILLTGLYTSAQQIPALALFATGRWPTWDELWTGFYNSTLGLKIALFAVMIAFGAVNLLVISPRFRRWMNDPVHHRCLFTRFRLTVGAEVLLGLGAIFLAGLLTLTPPPRSQPAESVPAIAERAPTRPTILVGHPAPNVRVRLEIGPDPVQPTLFEAWVSDAQGNPLPDLQRVIFQLTYLEKDTGIQNVIAEPRPDGRYVVEGNNLPLDGMWRIRVLVRQRGVEDRVVDLPYYVGVSTPKEEAPDARLLLAQAQEAMNRLTTLRSTQELNDGAAGFAVSHYEYQVPDRTRFQVEGQGESIAIGAMQYLQNADGTWTERPRMEPFRFPDFNFVQTAQGIRLGRVERARGTPAQLVLFYTPNVNGTEQIHYAYWIDQATQRVLQVAMVANAHYMLQSYWDFDARDIAIAAPSKVVPAPTAVAVTGSTTALSAPTRPRGFITGDLEGDGALVLVVVGIVILLVGSGSGRERKTRLTILGIGAAAVVVGIALFVDAVNATMTAANAPVNTVRAMSGQEVYVQKCAVCHGAKGYGDGPGGASLPVKPFDLTIHALQHDEQYLFMTVLNGRGYMPAFGDQLTQDQILDVVSYIRLLALQARQTPNAPRAGFTPQP